MSQEHPALRLDIGATSREYEETQSYIQGKSLYFITIALCTCLFITNIEIPIVTTALVSISGDLEGFNKASWVITAYMLGYIGVLVMFSKLSDIFGRKAILLFVLTTFTIFSAACGASQSVEQLIVFRSLQGVGGAGNFAVCSVIFLELVPSHKYAKYTSSTSVVYSLSLVLGPILGGVISQYTTWRWVFLINVPVALLAAVIIFFTLPVGFPFHGRPGTDRPNAVPFFSRQAIQRIDITGTVLLLVSTVLLVAALEEGGTRFPWRSGFVIALLTLSSLGWIVFLLWERHVTLRSKLQAPVFPWRFAQSRVYIGLTLNALFIGAAFFCTTFQLPQRLQIVNGLSPIQAGIRFLPFTLASPLGSAITPAIAKVAKVPPIYLIILATIFQVMGFAFLSTLPDSKVVVSAQYGYQILAGFGCGANITLTLLLTPFCVQERDKAVAMATISQFRVMGGVIGLSIITAAFNGLVRDRVEELLQSPVTIGSFPPDIQEVIRVTFSEGYRLQIKILSGLAAGQLPASFLMWQKDQITI
ncbi:MFS multidrug transporter-like protein [Camillea tinctor]|nr:MFS multidrug transporter-like protein [Camillea tinctor]